MHLEFASIGCRDNDLDCSDGDDLDGDDHHHNNNHPFPGYHHRSCDNNNDDDRGTRDHDSATDVPATDARRAEGA
jgi:hypothetical protein